MTRSRFGSWHVLRTAAATGWLHRLLPALLLSSTLQHSQHRRPRPGVHRKQELSSGAAPISKLGSPTPSTGALPEPNFAVVFVRVVFYRTGRRLREQRVWHATFELRPTCVCSYRAPDSQDILLELGSLFATISRIRRTVGTGLATGISLDQLPQLSTKHVGPAIASAVTLESGGARGGLPRLSSDGEM